MEHSTPRGQQAGFTLIELMIVIAIIAILALIAMPQYQNFVAKSQATAALAEIAPGKVSVETAIADGEVPSTADEIGLQASTERCTSIDVAFDDSGVGSITCSAIKGSTDVKDANIALERDDTGAWKCTTTIAMEKIMPKGCGT